MSEPDRHELFERYKLAHAECRAETQLGWERQRAFWVSMLTLNTIAVVTLRNLGPNPELLLCAAVTALVGVIIVRISHERYRAARDALLALEDQIGITDLQTTGGQRAARGRDNHHWRVRIVDVLSVVFVLVAGVDVAFALAFLQLR